MAWNSYLHNNTLMHSCKSLGFLWSHSWVCLMGFSDSEEKGKRGRKERGGMEGEGEGEEGGRGREGGREGEGGRVKREEGW